MNNFITRINKNNLEIKDKKEKINFDMAIWCGGIKISPLSKYINKELNLECNKGIPVNSFFQVKNQKNLFAMGDCAYSKFPPTAQVAYQQGIYLAKYFNSNFNKNNKFEFKNKGQIGYIGNGQSVYQNDFFQGGGKIIGYFNKLVHIYNFSKISIKSRFFN
jgi:NADH dehydrogenase FAD-containing subunit